MTTMDPVASKIGNGESRNADRQSQLAERLAGLMERLSLSLHPPMLGGWPDLGLTMHQLVTLTYLRTGPQRLTDISGVLGIRLSSTTSVIDRLESKKLVQRLHDPVDRRVVRCHLTPAGRREADNLWHIDPQWVRNALHDLPPQTLEDIIRSFETLAEALDKQTPSQSAQGGNG